MNSKAIAQSFLESTDDDIAVIPLPTPELTIGTALPRWPNSKNQYAVLPEDKRLILRLVRGLLRKEAENVFPFFAPNKIHQATTVELLLWLRLALSMQLLIQNEMNNEERKELFNILLAGLSNAPEEVYEASGTTLFTQEETISAVALMFSL